MYICQLHITYNIQSYSTILPLYLLKYFNKQPLWLGKPHCSAQMWNIWPAPRHRSPERRSREVGESLKMLGFLADS